MNGDKESGVCVIEMLKKKEGIDTGAIWGKSQLSSADTVDFGEARDILGKEGGELLVKVMRDMIKGTVRLASE